MTVTAAQLGLSASQFHNAQGIIAAVKARRWGAKAAVIAVEVALTESGMRILASANVPQSKLYPHDLLSWTSDGLGHDHASCGMYQQQTGYRYAIAGTSTMGTPDGWGTPAELMNPVASTTKFLNALAQHPWQSMTNWAAAQAVQHSAFSSGSNYRQQDARANHIVGALWGSPVSVAKPTPTPAKHAPVKKAPVKATGTYVVKTHDTLTTIATHYGTTWRVLQKLNNLSNPNTIRVGQTLRITNTTPAPKPAPKPAYRIVGTHVVHKGETLTGICHGYPQAWITPASVAHINGMSSPDHLVIGQVLRIGG